MEPDLEHEHAAGNTYDVEAILAERTKNGQLQYLLKWEGYELHE